MRFFGDENHDPTTPGRGQLANRTFWQCAIKVGEPVAPPQDKMDKVRILADIPASERPKVRVIDPKSAWFKAEIESARARMGADFSACASRIPSEVK